MDALKVRGFVPYEGEGFEYSAGTWSLPVGYLVKGGHGTGIEASYFRRFTR